MKKTDVHSATSYKIQPTYFSVFLLSASFPVFTSGSRWKEEARHGDVRREHVLRQAEFAPPTTCPPKAHGFAHARIHVTNLTKTKPAKPACSLSRRNLQVFGVSGIQSLLNWSAIDYCAGIIEQGELHESIGHCGIVILIIAQHEYRSSHCAKFSGHGP